MMIEDVIKMATDEFNANGRSDKFIEIENSIIEKNNSTEIYFFARYAKGASVKRMQNALIKNGALMEGYYFQQNVAGADITKFVNLAMSSGKKFWLGKFINLANKTEQYDKISHLVDGLNVDIVPEKLDGCIDETDQIIKIAQKEYKHFGRSSTFKKIEQFMLHADAIANTRLFMKHVPGVNKKMFEYVAILRGQPLNMYLIAIDVKGVDKELMLRGLELSKLDYKEVEKGWDDIARQRERIISGICSAEGLEHIEHRIKLLKSYNLLPKVPEYIAKIDNEYIAGVKYAIRQDYKKSY